MPSRRHRLTLLLSMGLIVGVMAGTASAEPQARASGVIAGTVTSATLVPVCASPFADGLVLVDAYDVSTKVRYGSVATDEFGAYSLSGLPTGDYKVRFRHFDDDTKIDAYWWYQTSKAEPRALTFETGSTVSVIVGSITTIDPCLGPFVGGTFKGSITPVPVGIDLQCVQLMAFEASSGIGVGLLDMVRNTDGKYRYITDMPPGDYRALAWQVVTPDPPCNTHALELLGQWWKGHSGPDYFEMSNAKHWDSGSTFAVTAGGVTSGIHFSLMPLGTCDGKVPTILGTTGDDVLVGTAGPDVIMLYHGDDEAHGNGGKDAICGGKGSDNLFGGDANDRIWGDRHTDYLHGENGNDLLFGNAGNDQLFGGLDNDKLRGGTGDDLMHGNDGNDTLWGNKGDDNMFGQADDDTLYGGPGNDLGDGGTGVDTCVDIEIPTAC